MDILSPLLLLLFRALFVVLPLTVAWLAFRRLWRSRSSNAWIYAATCLLTAVLTTAMLPWTLGLGTANWLVLLLALFSPALWLGVILICDPFELASKYDAGDVNDSIDTPIARAKTALALGKPLILEKPNWPDAPTPMFRHGGADVKKSSLPIVEEPRKSLLSIAKGMRGNRNSDKRRPKLLPSPKRYGDDLSFLPEGRVTRP